jgi:enoyl-CoA hydratase
MMLDLIYRDDVAILTLNRPEVLNALNFALVDQIGDAIDSVGKSTARALIITGTGEKAFCAGADVGELVGRSLADQKAGAERGQAAFAKLDRLAVPSIALVNGFALGGGAELALACTFRLATDDARFGLPEIKLGLIPGYGGTQRLPRLVGESRAMEIVLTGRLVAAEEALQIGLVNQIVEAPALNAAIGFAHKFTGFGLLAAGLAREAVQRAAGSTLADGLRIEADLSTLAYRTADADEGMQAFLEKRPPQFGDR